MPLRTLQIAPGAPMTEALGSAIAELKAGDPLNAVTVLVGDHTHDASLRRALARQDGGIAAVDFVTVAELARKLACHKLISGEGEALGSTAVSTTESNQQK